MDYEPDSLAGAILHDNYFFMLQTQLGAGVPLRVVGRSFIPYNYDPLGAPYNPSGANNPNFNSLVTSKQFIDPFLLGTATNNVQDIFQPIKPGTIYQLFFGWSPTQMRVYRSVPYEQRLGRIENITGVWSASNPHFGFLPDSNIDSPSRGTETMLPEKVEVGLALYNPLPYTIAPFFRVYVNKLKVKVVRDVKLIERMLMGTLGTIKSVSATQTSEGVDTTKLYGIEPISYDATESEIVRILRSAKA